MSSHWGDADHTRQLAEIHWMGSPVVRAYLNRLVSGDPAQDWLTWTWNRWVRGQDLTVAVLGCGEGWLERSIAGDPRIAANDACDVAADAVERARQQAAAEGLDNLRYQVIDLNLDRLPRARYDVVIAHSVLHHVENLEHCYGELERVLAPDGLLILNEYVGPTRFQFTQRQMAVINRLLARLPERFRRSAATGGIYPRKEVPTVEEMIATDPSEAVRSASLEEWTSRTFEVLWRAPYGGTILHHLLYDIVQNFSPTEIWDDRLLAFLCFVEEALMAEGVLPADFVVAVAQLPGGPGRRGGSPDRRPRALPLLGDGEGENGAVATAEVHSRPSWNRRLGLAWPSVRDTLQEWSSGFPECDWWTWVLAEAGPAPGDRVLVLVDDQRRWLAGQVAAGGIDPVVIDPRHEAIPAGPFDLVLTNGVLGLAEDRQALVSAIAQRLVAGGRWLGDEYGGPTGGFGSRRALHYARQCLPHLGVPVASARWRRSVAGWYQERRRAAAVAMEELLAESFAVELRRPLGGAVRQRVFSTYEAVAGDQVPEDDRALALAAMMCDLERWLIEAGALENDDFCFIARRRSS
ncbi:MAG: class I SAM-dependent methyltransferase [Acidobacteriota bacterium]